MKVLKRISGQEHDKELLLLSGDSLDESKIVLYIIINNKKGEFIARKVKNVKSFNESSWELQKGYTFPSSIFYEFIKEPPFHRGLPYDKSES